MPDRITPPHGIDRSPPEASSRPQGATSLAVSSPASPRRTRTLTFTAYQHLAFYRKPRMAGRPISSFLFSHVSHLSLPGDVPPRATGRHRRRAEAGREADRVPRPHPLQQRGPPGVLQLRGLLLRGLVFGHVLVRLPQEWRQHPTPASARRPERPHERGPVIDRSEGAVVLYVRWSFLEMVDERLFR